MKNKTDHPSGAETSRMRVIKGIMYKDFYLKRGNLFLGLLIWLLLFIISASIYLSFDFGNLKNNTDINKDSFSVLVYASSIVLLFTVLSDSGVVYSDRNTNWNRFMYSCPVSAESFCLTKIVSMLISAAVGFPLSIISTALLFNFAHREFDIRALKNLTLLLIVIFFCSCAVTAVMMKFKTPSKANFFLTAAGIITYLIIILPILKTLWNSGEDMTFSDVFSFYAEIINGMGDIIFPFSVLIIAAILFISFHIFVKIEKRREN